MKHPGSLIVLVLIALVAATGNGALGYGFSSITVPTAFSILHSSRSRFP